VRTLSDGIYIPGPTLLYWNIRYSNDTQEVWVQTQYSVVVINVFRLPLAITGMFMFTAPMIQASLPLAMVLLVDILILLEYQLVMMWRDKFVMSQLVHVISSGLTIIKDN